MISEEKQKIDYEINRIIESISEKIRIYYESLISITEIEIDNFLLDRDIHKQNAVNYVKTILNAKPLIIVNDLFTEITKDVLEIKFDFINVKEIHEDTYLVRIEIDLDEFSVLTHFDFHDILVYSDDGYEISKEVISYDIKISNINHFTSKVQLEGTLKVNPSATTFYVVDSLDKRIQCKVTGIKNSYSKQWFENLVHGAIYYELGNLRMSYFNIFSGIDEFVNLVYDKLFDIYIDEYSNAISEMHHILYEYIKEELVENDTTELYHKMIAPLEKISDKHEKMKYLRDSFPEVEESNRESVDDNIDDFLEELYSIIERDFEERYSSFSGDSIISNRVSTIEIESVLKEQIRKFSNNNIRLREKIRICSENVGMNRPTNHQNEFKNYYELLKKFDVIEKNRNAIAHGRKVDNLEVDDLLYFSFTLILSLCLNCDFEKRGWTRFIIPE